MEAKKNEAIRLFEAGTNCCQAVICAYAEDLGVSRDDVFRMTEGFGLGMGGLQDTCGAVTGMFLVISLANCKGSFEEPLVSKMDTYAKIRHAAEEFRSARGSIYCRDLLTEKGPQPLPCCTSCVAQAAEILDRMFEADLFQGSAE